MNLFSDVPKSPELWVVGSGILIEENVQGAFHAETGLSLGYRAGPSREVSNLLHEFGHFLETSEDRFLQRDWGLWLHSEEYGPAPRTAQASLRELRVYGIQKVLCEHMGVDWDLDMACHSLRFMPDWICLERFFAEPYGQTSTPSKTLSAKMTAHVLQEAQKHTPSSLYAEFRRRCDIHDATFPSRSQ